MERHARIPNAVAYVDTAVKPAKLLSCSLPGLLRGWLRDDKNGAGRVIRTKSGRNFLWKNI